MTHNLNDALIDTRHPKERIKDYVRDEIMLASSGVPYTNQRPTEVGATVYNQYQTSSCVAHAVATALEYEGIITAQTAVSQLQLYRKRLNYPNSGAHGYDLFDKLKLGQTKYKDSPTPVNASEIFANTLPLLLGAKFLKDFSYFNYSDGRTANKALSEYVPDDVHNGKAIVIFIYASNAEWRKEYVEPTANVTLYTAPVRHAVVLIPRGDFTQNGKRWLAVHDSAHFGGRYLRYISEEFLEKRVYWGATIVKKDTPTPPPPVYGLPVTACSFGDRSLAVSTLQAYLVGKKFLAPQYITGYYGQLTSKAVLWFQLYHHDMFDDSIPQLLALKGAWWGSQSIAVINKLNK